MADLEDIGVLVPWAEMYPLARNARGLNRTDNPIGAVLMSADLALPFPEDFLTISGTVRDIDDEPVARRVIVASEFLRLVIESASGADGAYAVRVPPGTYRVIASGEPNSNDLILSGVEPV
jgi:hypothetical protein